MPNATVTNGIARVTRRSWCARTLRVPNIQPPGWPQSPTPQTLRPLTPRETHRLHPSQRASHPLPTASTSVQSTYLLEPAV